MRYFYFVVLTTFLQNTFSQSIANYSSARNTSVSYTSISSTGNAFASWRNSSGNTQDDNRSDFTNIGFDFWYNGIRYTQFSVSTNGFLDFSTSTDDGGPQGDDFGYDNAAFSTFNTANATRPAIAPFYDDLTAQGNVASLGNSIVYAVSGTAPNRSLTVEWINMAVFQNVTPSLNFQVKLMESTGVIQVNYGTMNTGTNIFSYSMGLNGPTLSFFPTAAQLKMQQTANQNSFSNTAQSNLSAMPAGNSQYVFTPPAPTAVSGNLTFSGVSQTTMTLNWSNWASNEIGYVIYNSTDNVNFDFAAQTAANATSSSITGLLPSTTYYWRVYAVTEGCLSAALNGTQATSPAGNKISNSTGNWNTASIWTPNGVPTAGDNVTIANGHTVSINVSGQCNNLTVGQGAAATLRFNGNTARLLTVNNNITVNSNAIFNVNTTSNQTHTLMLEGNIVNNGTINFIPDGDSFVNTMLLKNGNGSISGSGSNIFNNILVNLGGTGDMMEITASNFSATAGFLNLQAGIFKISTVNAVNVTPFNSAATISSNNGLWLNSANLTLNTTAGIVLNGSITISNGTLNVGNGADEDLELVGGSVRVANGALNIAGKLDGSDINNTCTFNLSGGNVTVPTSSSGNTSIAPFHISGAGSECNLTGGLIVIQREGGNGSQHLGFLNTNAGSAIVTGGTLQIGNAATPAGQIIDINTDAAVHNLLVNSANATARLNTNALNVTNNITISAGALNANNLNISLGGNWSNSGTFTPGSASVTFTSAAAQSIFKTGGETFNHLNAGGAGLKTLLAPVTANGNFSIATGASVDVGASSFSLAVKGNFTNNGSFLAQNGLVQMNGTSTQNIGGSTTTNFYNLGLNNTSGLNLTNAENLLGTLTLSNGNFNINSQAFTMISNASGTARIAQITGTGDINGNITIQRYVPGGATGWALLGNPISSALTFSDWDDDLIITCPNCPDGNAAFFTSVYSYSEAVTGLYDAPASYVAINSISDAITAGKGYWLYLGNSQFTTTAVTIDVTGTVRKNNYTIPLTRTNTGSAADDGWNLIHNPYPSAISWAALRGATANLDNAIYVYNADLNSGAGNFASYVNGVSSPAVGAGGVGDNIPMFQGFYVHSTGATALNAQESNKVAADPAFLKASSASGPASLVRLQLSGPNSFMDEAVLYFETNATDTFDTSYDAYKMRGQDPYAPFLALETGTNSLQINGIPPVTGNYTTALKALTGYTGTYTLSAANIASFSKGACITLYDQFTASTTDLRTSDYIFTLSDTTTVARFLLSVTLNSLSIASSVQQPDCQQPNKGRIVALPASAGPWNYYWTSNGSVVQTSLNVSTADSIYNLGSGNFELEVTTVGTCDYNQSSYSIYPQQAVTASIITTGTIFSTLPAQVQFNNGSLNASQYDWDFGTGQDVSTAASPLFIYTSPGIYNITLIATSATGCQDTSSTIIVVKDAAAGIKAQTTQPGFRLNTLSSNEFMLEATGSEAGTYKAVLTDPSGKVIADYGKAAWENNRLHIYLEQYAPGIYFLSLSSKTEQLVVKLPVN